MPNNDSIDRNVVLNHLGDLFTLCRETGSITEKDLESFEKIIKSLSPVPHEMSARELFNAYQRICEEYSHKGIPVRCDECPLYASCPRIVEALRMVLMCSPIVEA